VTLTAARSEYGDFETVQWLETMNRYDPTSLPLSSIQMTNILSASGLYDQAFSESVIDSFDFDFPETKSGVERWACLEGGSSVLIDAMTARVQVKPTLNHRVTAISIDRSDIANPENNMVVQFRNGLGIETRHYSTVFNTASLACSQRMDLTGAELHPTQKDALRCLRYDASSKVAIVFKTPWWIIKGIDKGGAASTDYPIRTCVYPSYNINDDITKPSVLLCSYSWAQDAQRIGGLIDSKTAQGKNEELKELMLNDLAVLHSNIITRDQLEEQFMELNAHDWYANPNTSGAFALFGPGQFSHLYPLLCRPTADGNLHFVGEGMSPPPYPLPFPILPNDSYTDNFLVFQLHQPTMPGS
jgi:monoamine oxidase